MFSTAGVALRYLMMLLASLAAIAQPATGKLPATCEEMTEVFRAFRKTYDFSDPKAPKANQDLTERKFGPADNREPYLAGERLSYEVDGCAGLLIFDGKGILYSVEFRRTGSGSQPRESLVLQRVQALTERIAELQRDLQRAKDEQKAILSSLNVTPELLPAELKGFAERPLEGDYLLHSGRNQDAIAAYARVIENNPDHSAARFRRAIAYQRQGLHRQAIDDYESVLKSEPHNRNAKTRMALAMVASGDVSGAISTNSQPISKSQTVAVEVTPETMVVKGFTTASAVRETPRPAPILSAPRPRVESPTYYTGPRGGCYTITSGGNKRYVDRSMCQ